MTLIDYKVNWSEVRVTATFNEVTVAVSPNVLRRFFKFCKNIYLGIEMILFIFEVNLPKAKITVTFNSVTVVFGPLAAFPHNQRNNVRR